MDKQEKYKNIITFTFSFIILALNTAIWGYIWITQYADIILRPFGYRGNWLVIVVYATILMFFTNFYGGYKVGYYLPGDVILSSILSLIITNFITYLQSSLIVQLSIDGKRSLLSVIPFLMITLIQSFLIVIWAFVTNRIYIKRFPPYEMLLIYGGDKMARSLIRKMMSRDERYQIKEVISIDEGEQKVYQKVLTFQSILLVDLPPKERNKLMKYCYENSIRTYLTPKISEIIVRGAEDVTLFDTPLILSENQGLSLEQRFVKRAFDLATSVVGLIISFPFMLATAIVVKAQDGGPVLFKQTRCTIDNKEFDVIKFRSMVVDAEKDGQPHPATDNDARITKVGKFIRAVRLDEFPQLINVLKGEMSIVGPRPERIEHVKKYTEEIPEFSMRSKVKAGLTGYAQIYGKYNTTAYDKLKLDMMYITKYSFFNDVKLIMMTVKIMFVKSSTEGFE